MAYIDTTLQSVSKEGNSESDPKMEATEPTSTLWDEINQIMPKKNQLEELIDNKEAMQTLLEKMGKWFLTNMDKTLEIIKKGLAKDYLTYPEFCCIMIDQSAPFRFFEICAAVLELSLQETGTISIEEIMKIIPSTTDPITCNICGLGMTKSGDEIPVLTVNTSDLVKASDKTAFDISKITFENKLELKGGGERKFTDRQNPKDSKCLNKPTQAAFSGFVRKLIQAAFSGFARKSTHVNKATFENKLELKGGGGKNFTHRNSKESKHLQKHSTSNQSLSIMGENRPALNKESVPFYSEKKYSSKLSVNQLSIPNKLDPVKKLDIQNENMEVQEKNTYEEMIHKMTKSFEKSISSIIVSDTIKFPVEAKSEQIKSSSPFEMENEAKSTAALLTQPIVIERFVLVQLKFVIYCDIASCDSHFSVLLNSEACVSYLVHRIRDVSDASSQEIYLSPNRLRLRQMLLPHDRSLKDCGYQGYCKSHPQKITLYYDYDKHYKPGFIEILNELNEE